MKKIRSTPFGYLIRNGEIQIKEKEAEIVKQIYSLYGEGGSLDSVALEIQKNNVPYSESIPIWNKHMIKRILENEKYSGVDNYPEIITTEEFARIRKIYAEKTNTFQNKGPNPEKHIWSKMICAKCGNRMIRGGGLQERTILVCKTCKEKIVFNTESLKERLLNNLKKEMCANQETDLYTPTPELLKLENAIMRETEKAEDGSQIRKMILEAAAKRYIACPTIKEEIAPDWQMFKEKVETVFMSTDEITIRLKE